MDGKMGACPDWYALIQAAKYLGCKPWELLEQGVYWRIKAHEAMAAEHQGQEIKNQLNKK